MVEKIKEQEKYSTKTLDAFREKIGKSDELLLQRDLCIYTTGSFGRSEAGIHSDIDLFFLYKKNNEGDKPFSRISKTLIDADIIRTTREMGLPEFSGDGEYLEIHEVENIYKELGSRKEDYHNYFTARMLLLLESKPIYNDALHDEIIDTTIGRYYQDFEQHEHDFKPIFIVNDVIRFWRTMCLNYEHSRNNMIYKNEQLSEKEIIRRRNKDYVKNLKLRFSRKLTCYSFLLSVLWSGKILSKNDIKSITALTPLRRLIALKDEHKEISGQIDLIIELYFWFLKTTQIEKGELLEWINDEANKKFAFSKSKEFARAIYEIMMHEKNEENLMYFLI